MRKYAVDAHLDSAPCLPQTPTQTDTTGINGIGNPMAEKPSKRKPRKIAPSRARSPSAPHPAAVLVGTYKKGQLPFDMPMEFLMDPAHPSRPRNKIIAQAFFDMGIIERYGSGKYSWNSTNSKGARRRRRGSARVIARNRFE